MTPPAGAIRLISHQRRFAESIAQIDTELEFSLGRRRWPPGGKRWWLPHGPPTARVRTSGGYVTAGTCSFPMASTAQPDWPRPSGWPRHQIARRSRRQGRTPPPGTACTGTDGGHGLTAQADAARRRALCPHRGSARPVTG